LIDTFLTVEECSDQPPSGSTIAQSSMLSTTSLDHVRRVVIGGALASLSACGATSKDTPAEPTTNPQPVIDRLASDTVREEAPLLRIFGSGFVRSSVILLNGEDKATTFVSGTELRLDVPLRSFSWDRYSAQLNVRNPEPGGGTTPSRIVTLVGLAGTPVITEALPSTITAGDRSVTVTLRGRGFAGRSSVYLTPSPQNAIYEAVPATLVSNTELRVTLADSLTRVSRVLSFVVTTNREFGSSGTSAPRAVDVRNRAPVLTSLGTTEIDAGSSGVAVRVRGTGFAPNSMVEFDGVRQTTVFVDSTALDATPTDSALRRVGTAAIRIVNPAPGGGTSNDLPLRLRAVTATLSALPVSGAHATGRGYTTLLHGARFIEGSVVLVNGQSRTTTYVSATRIAVGITSADVSAPGTLEIAVDNPGAATSISRRIAVRSVAPTALTSIVATTAWLSTLVADTVRQRLYGITETRTPEARFTLQAIETRTGAVVGSIPLSGAATAVGLSDDASQLYVGQPSGVQRIDAATFTVGPTLSIPSGPVFSLLAIPAQPRSIGVVVGDFSTYGGISIYRDGAALSQRTTSDEGGRYSVFAGTTDTLYSLLRLNGVWSTVKLAVSADGVRRTGAPLAGGQAIVGAGGRLYTIDGNVVDAGSARFLGTAFTTTTNFPTPFDVSAIAVSPELGRLFVRRADGLRVYDINTFSLLGTVALPPGTGAAMNGVVRCGADCLAFADVWGALTIVRSPLFGG
jgi:hypothetical protein